MRKKTVRKSNCNLCKSEKYNVLFCLDKNNFKFMIVKCKDCGLVYINPQPTLSKIENMYTENYYAGKGFDTGVNYIEGLKYNEGWDYILHNRLSLIEKFSKKGRLLDLGCGFGEFLEVAKKRGWQTYGIELSRFAAKIAKKKFKLNVYNKTLEQKKFPDNYFEVITMFEVIEHLQNPLQTLKECHRILNKKGILVVQTGDVESVYAKFRGKKWSYYLAGHLYYFSRKTLSVMLKKAGFDIIRIYSGDEISFGARTQSFWTHKNKNNLSHWIEFFKLIIITSIRKLGLGGMTIYAKKQ